MAFAGELADRLRGALSDVERARVLGPVPAPIARLRGKHRFHVLANAPGGDALRAAVLSVSRNVTPPDEVHWVADIDPLGMM